MGPRPTQHSRSRENRKILFTQAAANPRVAEFLVIPDKWPTRAFAMTSAHSDAQAIDDRERYRALLAVSEAIVSHRDLSALLHDLAGRLQQVVRFDYLGLLLHEAES